MGFFEKIKKVFESEDNFESHNKDDRNNKDELAESLKNDNSNEKKEIKYGHSEESVLNGKVSDEQAMVRNFKYLDDLIHSGVKEIVLDSDIVLGSDEESQYLEGIKLDVDDLTIDGNGFTVDARVETRIFYCTGKNIIIRNITLKNGFTKKDGGAIHNHKGSLTITESALQENTAPKGAGGAIHNYEGEIKITETKLQENIARDYGGAINNWGELTITESTLQQNTAQWSCGAIHNLDEKSFKIKDCKLDNNIPNNY